MIEALGGLADVERDLIRTRTAGGRSRVKAQGKAMGRPPFPDTGTAERGYQTPRAGATLKELAESYNSTITTKRRVTRAA
jgi:DNA invertase Pin-like site-specific DNA recombinase